MFDGHAKIVKVPDHIAAKIRDTIVGKGVVGRHIDNEAARYGAIALMGTLGSTWILRPDGTFWDVDEELETTLTPLPEADHFNALFYGIDRFPWLSELRPQRSELAIDCSTCKGAAGFEPVGAIGAGFRSPCLQCNGLGWLESPK